MTEHATGVIDEGNQFRLPPLHMWSEHCIGLPQLIGVLHAERQTTFVFTGIIGQQFVRVDHPAERVSRDLIRIQQPLLNAEPVQRGLVRYRPAKVW